MNPRVKTVKVNNDFKLFLTFSNSEKKVFDVKPYLKKGVFVELQNAEMFKTAKVFNGTVVWGNDLDFCPDTLYLESETFNSLQGMEV